MQSWFQWIDITLPENKNKKRKGCVSKRALGKRDRGSAAGSCEPDFYEHLNAMSKWHGQAGVMVWSCDDKEYKRKLQEFMESENYTIRHLILETQQWGVLIGKARGQRWEEQLESFDRCLNYWSQSLWQVNRNGSRKEGMNAEQTN